MIWNISNILSLSRIGLTIPLGWALWNNDKASAIAFAALAYVTDVLDGYLARKLNQTSELGKIIDPIADKVLIAVSCAILTMRSVIPLWFVVAVVLRDAAIMIGGVWYERKYQFVPPSNYMGKLAVLSTGITMLLYFLHGSDVLSFSSSILSSALLALSFVLYSKRLFIPLTQEEKERSRHGIV